MVYHKLCCNRADLAIRMIIISISIDKESLIIMTLTKEKGYELRFTQKRDAGEHTHQHALTHDQANAEHYHFGGVGSAKVPVYDV